MSAAVGVFIGCSMNADQTQFKLADLPKDLRTLRQVIDRSIPVSAGKYNRNIGASARHRIDELEALALQHDVDPDAFDTNWRVPLGSLGDGNHFIAICVDEHEQVGTFPHSGSRGIGNRIHTHYLV